MTPSHLNDQQGSALSTVARRTARVAGSVVVSILVAMAIIAWLMLGVVNGLW